MTENRDSNSNNINTSNNSNNKNNNNNTQDEWLSETKETLSMFNCEPGMIRDNGFQEDYKNF